MSLRLLEYNSLEEQLGSDHRPVIALYESSLLTPLNMLGDTLIELTKNQAYILQITYMEVTLDIFRYTSLNPALFQPKNKADLHIYICFEENELLMGDKASNLTKLEQLDDLQMKFNLRGNELPFLYFATNNFEQIRQSSLNLQVCLGENALGREVIGFGAMSLVGLQYQKPTNPMSQVPLEAGPTLDLKTNIYYYSVCMGKLALGAKLFTKSRKLKV